MNTLLNLQSQAIAAAKALDWPQAITVNQEIIELEPQNIGALNRLGFCYLQLEEFKKAKTYFNQVLELDPTNSIAAKQLKNIAAKRVTAPAFTDQPFVEEPGKSKVIALHRLAAKNILENLAVGQELSLKPKNRYISVETRDKVYVGSLPEDVSLRLSKLINTGNQYLCQVHSFSHNACSVYIREAFRSPENTDKLSFPVSKGAHDLGGDLADEWFIENNIPIDLNDDDGGEGLDMNKDISSQLGDDDQN